MSARPRCARRSRRWARSRGWSTGHRGRGRTGGRSARAEGRKGAGVSYCGQTSQGCGVRRGLRVGRGMRIYVGSRRFNVAGRSRASPRRTWKKPKQSSRPGMMMIRETEGTGRSVSARGGLTAILVRRDLKENSGGVSGRRGQSGKLTSFISRIAIRITALRRTPAWHPPGFRAGIPAYRTQASGE